MTSAPTLAQPASASAEPQFDWADPLLLEEALSEDERMVRDSAHAYCQEKLFPRVLEANRYERFDREIMTEPQPAKAAIPVCARPRIRAWMSWVPS